VRAAQALEKAFKQFSSDLGVESEIRHIDTLDYTNKVFRHLYSKAYIDLVTNSPKSLAGSMTNSIDPGKTSGED